jgi:LacI family transcriptional regulator
MSKRPTRKDVAVLAKVSVATVSYVINGGPRPVAADTRQRVLDAVEQLGYRPHAIARSLKTGNTHTVALLVQSLIEPFTGYFVNAIERCLDKQGYELILASSHEDREREKRLLDVLAARSIDGLLYIPVSNKDPEPVLSVIDEGIPVIFVDRHIPGVPADVVMSDNVAAARRITDYMLEKGRRRILCISFSDEASSALDRVEGFRQSLRARGLPIEESMILVASYVTGEEFEHQLIAHIDRHGMPDSIFCTTNDLLVRTIKILRRRRVNVPEQVLVGGGFVHSPWNDLLEPPVPLVHQDFEVMAQHAVDFLIERLQGTNPPPRVKLIPARFFAFD